MSTQIVAPMPGKVIDILVNVGDAVEEAQEVLVLEAMKMENAIPAPAAGRVKEIAVRKGDAVSTRQLLMTLD